VGRAPHSLELLKQARQLVPGNAEALVPDLHGDVVGPRSLARMSRSTLRWYFKALLIRLLMTCRRR
jgi:hypothetical protein